MYQAFVLLLTAALIVLDQFTKLLALAFLQQEPFAIIPGVFEFHFTTNPGVAFGLFPGNRWIFIGLTSVVVLVILAVLLSGRLRVHHKMLTASGILIVAGGLGNLIDRIFRGEVVDFLYFKLIDFPIFNLADCYVVVGAALLLIFYLFLFKDEKSPSKAAAPGRAQTGAEGGSPHEGGTPDSSAGQGGGEA